MAEVSDAEPAIETSAPATLSAEERFGMRGELQRKLTKQDGASELERLTAKVSNISRRAAIPPS